MKYSDTDLVSTSLTGSGAKAERKGQSSGSLPRTTCSYYPMYSV